MTQASGDRFHILCAADAAYGPWTGVMIASILEHDHGGPLHIHLLSDGVAARDLHRMETMASNFGAVFSSYDVSGALAAFGSLRSRPLPYLTRAAVARLLFDRYIDLASGRMLYCDSDIICVRSLRDLFLIPLGDAIVGAVPNGLSPGGRGGAHNRLLGLPTEYPYVNSGVLLIDVKRWREAEIGRRAVAYIRDNASRLIVPDQDALNAVLGERILPLPPWWNFQIGGFPLAQEAPIALIHFAGPVKPWFAGYRRAFRSEFRHAKRHSPWRATVPVMTLGRVLRRWQRSIRKRLPGATRRNQSHHWDVP